MHSQTLNVARLDSELPAVRSRVAPAAIGLRRTIEAATLRVESVTPAALRLSLALVFIWFGALKLAGMSPVAALISATLPWANPHVAVGALGVVEVILGVGLMIGRMQRLLLLGLAAHLSGTFLTFVMAPGLTVQHGNPMLLTADGEFVLKNLVLISAALLLASRSPRNHARP
jgi:putative oxidoreductase